MCIYACTFRYILILIVKYYYILSYWCILWENIILKSLAVDDFKQVYGVHTISLHDFNIQTISIDLAYSFSFVYMKNAEWVFMLTHSYIVSYWLLNIPIYFSYCCILWENIILKSLAVDDF